MGRNRLILRGLSYYWRTHVAVVLGVAIAVAVLSGALLVGDSVRGSLRDLVVQRLGETSFVVVSGGFFRAQLADSISRQQTFHARFGDVCPLVVVEGVVLDQGTGRRANRVNVYGVDDRFWRFHKLDLPTEAGSHKAESRERGNLDADQAFVSPALAEQIGAGPGNTILVRVQRPSAIPLESLHGRKEDVGRSLRVTVREVLPASRLGEFSLDPRQGGVRAVFVPLSALQKTLELGERVNTLLVSGGDSQSLDALEQLVRSQADLDDVGLTLTVLEERRGIAVGSDAGLLNDAQVDVVRKALAGSGFESEEVFTYLANSLKHGDREVPYSLVTAGSRPPDRPGGVSPERSPIVLNDWAARELGARVGDPVSLEYYVWEEPGHLATRTADLRVSGIVPVNGADRDLAPVFPGISDSPSFSEWDPPFPIDLRRVRPVDEAYWEKYRTTPKAFIPIDAGRRLWGSRYGTLTSIRLRPGADISDEDLRDQFLTRLRPLIDPISMGIAVRSVRTDGLAASRGATDFGEYFTYFSFFLVVAALVLATLFFKLSVEQRVKEVGLLRAVGFQLGTVRRMFLAEGLLLAGAGSALGVVLAVAYAAALMLALRTWWVDAVGTTALTLHVSGLSLAVGAVAGILAAVGCIWWTLRALSQISERSLLAGQPSAPSIARPVSIRRFGYASALLGVLGGALLAASGTGRIGASGAFFGAGTALLAASLCLFAAAFRFQPRTALAGHGWRALSGLGLRNATYRPGRSVLSIAVIASATFILIAVDAFRRDGSVSVSDPHSGAGGYALLVESLLPVIHDPNTADGRSAMNLFNLDKSVRLEPFRLLPGDDASCLNLYEPRNPRILAPTDAFLQAGRFAFQSSMATTDAERANPWLLLNRTDMDGAVPVIADANSMTYVLHRKLGEEIVVPRGGQPLRLRLVGALHDSILQGELVMSQGNFRRLFPEQEGYRFFLVDAPPEGASAAAAALEEGLSDVGAEVTSTAERLAQFHKVENTYLSTFQTLGGLGLLLGTMGLATVVLRNALERRRELALLAAVGYERRHFLLMIAAENVVLLGGGLIAGALCAGLAILPAVVERGGRIPLTTGGSLLLFAVFLAGLLSSILATHAATRGPLLEALRSE